jgi:protein-disulfide isomerase
VTIQVWSDFQCPFCKRVEPTLDALRKEFPNQLRIVWRHMPLPFHAQAPLAAETAEEVLAQKGNAAFWAFHDRVFEAQSEPDGLSVENLERIAVGLGVDPGRLREALDTHKHRPTLDADSKLAESIEIHGTPAFVINGYFVSGAQPTSAFRKLVRRALDDKRAGRK